MWYEGGGYLGGAGEANWVVRDSSCVVWGRLSGWYGGGYLGGGGGYLGGMGGGYLGGAGVYLCGMGEAIWEWGGCLGGGGGILCGVGGQVVSSVSCGWKVWRV